MTKDQFKTLCARVTVDKDFRQALLKSPVETAARLGIPVTEKEEQMIRSGADSVVNSGAKADELLASGEIRPMLIPIPALKPE